jgi:hypothetical protein
MMIRAAALTVVLTLVGAPMAQTACLIWCGGSCQQASHRAHREWLVGEDDCAPPVAIAPIVKDGNRIEVPLPSVSDLGADFPHLFRAALGYRRIAPIPDSEPPPGHLKPFTVLRI